MQEHNEYASIAPFYEQILGHLLYKPRLEVVRLCKEHNFKTLLDVGCGTGEQGVLAIANDLEFMGIDQDSAMLTEAYSRLPKETYLKNLPATNFAKEFLAHNNTTDVALCSLIIHEMPYVERLQVLEQIKKSARHLILIEYEMPSLAKPLSFLAHIPERLAGKRHYGCYRDFIKRGGIEGFVRETKLPVLAQSNFLASTIRIILLNLR